MNIPLLTWNVNGRTAKVLDAFIADGRLDSDLLTLQEVKHHHAAEFIQRLADLGFQSIHTGDPTNAGKTYGNLIASKWPMERIALRLSDPPPFPSLIGHARVAIASGEPVDVLTVHAPNGSNNGWAKIYTLEALRRVIETISPGPLIVTGDFNEPQFFPGVLPIRSWGWTREQTWEADRDKLWSRKGDQGSTDEHPLGRWDDAVVWFFDKDESHGLRHAYWAKHDDGAMEASYMTRSVSHPERWFDHAFVSSHFKVIDCTYRHDVRRPEGESDHSALSVRLAY
ncbi:endonuclease/exonuclease/phosphatase family protein [Synechococcus sp. CCY9201]|uniref:endonuclease/exonuclease/phosphatase family protein n=1 Tax=unclassified Synechococcus TaxID=2626047 RepID=UPI002AD579C1|nr:MULTISPECIES: endonuclease/exonuclease/phosphatase family protein [unclassified Synechococcus]MEA5475524.1 endonuclease/exonuclease/phosphatase family protein [Synechococcus sp. CCY9201]CAK6686468.1 hypothetical protein IFHNHDMJ_00005 [Synechococcus sp. CBW1107]